MIKTVVRWTLGIGLVAMILGVPFVYYRAELSRTKRLRVVEPGVLYRSGQMTAEGFREAIQAYGIKTIVNAMDESPDPELWTTWFNRDIVREQSLCKELGVRYVHLPPNLLSRKQLANGRPTAIDKWLEILDDPSNYPILLHCRAGLHRTGVMTALYRIEYHGWTPHDAAAEMKAHGFGDTECSSANDYVDQYIVSYKPGERHQVIDAEASEAGTAKRD